ncbi:acetyltransferase [Paracraurococcus lichenis]|uniref:Acetyltransferase n=1 Tax=Paracraurococcus lichenis TaxID=3064888 RepID=A0ABT9EBD6_9PROT|nr:acetyltransferase [Paracraurococcus sp. LOR1-02]MDO9713514.1 acetyltransferase [Paracraurococcus sp. LOR1-02]
MTKKIVLFAIGSPLLVDVEESSHRAGLHVAAGVRNWPGPHHLPDGMCVLTPESLTPELLELPFLVPLFTPRHRRSAVRQAEVLGFRKALTLIDPSVARPRRLELGRGCYVNAGVTVGSACGFDSFVLINRGATIGHHARLGAFVSIGPGAVLAGQVTVGAGSTVCAGAIILPGVTVGEDAVVGAGTVVTRDVPDGSLMVGNPGRIVRRDPVLQAV